MRVKRYTNIKDFLNENLAFLEQQEAANNLPIGIPMSLLQEANPSINLYSVFENETLVFSLVQTPPKNFLIYGQVDTPIFEALFSVLQKDKIQASGVIGEKELAIAFADFWKAQTGRSYFISFKQLVYQLDQVASIRLSKGQLRKATHDDLPIVAQWLVDFSNTALTAADPEEAKMIAQSKIESEMLYLWEDEVLVSMAAVARPTRNGITVNYVYTPPEYRGRGYASSCVTELSRSMLKQYKFCCLFTDLTNPTSNHIYKDIGYYPITEFREVSFL